jgi:hypothetical protein
VGDISTSAGVQIPRINIESVKRDLLSIQEVAGYFGIPDYSIKEILKKGGALSFSVGSKELIRRSDLNRILFHFPLNGLKEYPA